jgi:hypothetical protein
MTAPILPAARHGKIKESQPPQPVLDPGGGTLNKLRDLLKRRSSLIKPD